LSQAASGAVNALIGSHGGNSTGDTRPAAAEGETTVWPLTETPCPSCTSILDGLDGAAPHLAQRVNLAVVARSDPGRIGEFARERGWHNLRLLSSRNNAYNRDYHAETAQGEQLPILDVFVREAEYIRHFWATELLFAKGPAGEETRHVDLIWPIWHVLDMTPAGRGDEPNFPGLDYLCVQAAPRLTASATRSAGSGVSLTSSERDWRGPLSPRRVVSSSSASWVGK
jgi:Bacterial protein of unknown function (DUF899)